MKTNFGTFIKQERKKLKYSQFMLAKKANVSISMIQHIEYGVGNLNYTIATLIKLAIVFDMTLTKLIYESGLLLDFQGDLDYLQKEHLITSTQLSNESRSNSLKCSTSNPSATPLPI